MTVTVDGQAKTPRKWADKEGNEREAGFEVVARNISEGDDFWTTSKSEPNEYTF
jgi:hypothetical protein